MTETKFLWPLDLSVVGEPMRWDDARYLAVAATFGVGGLPLSAFNTRVIEVSIGSSENAES